MTSAATPRKSAFRVIRWLVVAVAALILLPYLIAPLYRVINPVSTLMVARSILGKRVERTWVPIDRVAPVLPRTVIASEDARFCSHRGVDMVEMRAALEDAEDITDARGGSTLTQQLAKNLFLWPGRSIVRKAIEFPLALWVDLVLPKRRIMEIYLNIAEWGPIPSGGAPYSPARGCAGSPASSRPAPPGPGRSMRASEGSGGRKWV
jgi:monofunctional biosynthetic peptidoglycan transglycosylase